MMFSPDPRWGRGENIGLILVFAMVCGVCNRGRDWSEATPFS